MAKPPRTNAVQNGSTEHAALLAQASGLPKSALSQNLDSKAKVRHAPGQQRGWLRIDSRGDITVVQVRDHFSTGRSARAWEDPGGAAQLPAEEPCCQRRLPLSLICCAR